MCRSARRPFPTSPRSLSPLRTPRRSQLTSALDLLPRLRSVDLTGCTAPVADRLAFVEQHENLSAGWTVSVEGQTFEWNTEFIDLNNYSIADVSALEAAFAELPKLTQVDMCDTNLSYEQLDALNQKLENIRIVWKVYFGTIICAPMRSTSSPPRGVTTRSISRTTTSTAGNTAPISRGSTSAT